MSLNKTNTRSTYDLFTINILKIETSHVTNGVVYTVYGIKI